MTKLLGAGIVLGTLVVGTGCTRTSASAPPVASGAQRQKAAAGSVEFHPWGDAAFELARREDKIVLVDVGIEGCTACRWMYEDTYRDAAVVQRLRESFVAISVDADVQPDLGVRFEEWGWPATIAFTPDREQVFALRGSRSPEAFAQILDDLVARKKKGTLKSGAKTDARAASASLASTTSDLREACLRITRTLDKDLNPKHGGWTAEGGQYIQGPSIEEAFLRARVEGRPDIRAHALLTLDGYAKMLDREWGGVFVAAHEVDFSGVIVEKRLVQEAEAMRSFALAYSATRDEKWKRHAGEIDRYLAGFLLAPDGTFYSTQQDEAPNLPPSMTSDDYFRLPDAERRKYGVPPVDHAVYTDQNGQAIEAYAMLFEATGDARMLDRATRAADAILATRMDPSGFVKQAAPTEGLGTDPRKRAFRPQAVPYLTAQGQLALGLVALHRVSGDARWLHAARTIMTAARKTLEDTKNGGFWASANDTSDPHAEKPVYENTVAARALHALAVYTHDETWERAAERTLLGARAKHGAFTALAAQELALGPVEISVTGSSSDARAKALYRAALDVHEPSKAVHWDTAHKYPDRGRPALYVCTRTSCSSPVYDPARVATAVAGATEARRSACE